MNGWMELIDDDELLVRASAVLNKEPGARKLVPRETRSSLGAYKLALCSGRIAGKSGTGKTAGGEASCGATGPGTGVVLFCL